MTLTLQPTIIFINIYFRILFMVSQFRSRRKISGGRYKAIRKKKSRELGREPLYTRIGETKVKILKGMGGKIKRCLTFVKEANVLVEGKYKKAKIESVVDNKANRHFIRRNLITKGAVIKTSLGNAKVVNRPGQEGFINAVLVK